MAQGSWVSLDTIVNSYIDETQQSYNNKFRLSQLAFRGMDNMGLDFFYQIKSVKIQVLANKTVPLPIDYIQYTKVGVLNGRGEIICLKYNDNLTAYAGLSANRLAKTVDNTLYDQYNYNTPLFYNYFDGNNIINLYGVPSGAPFLGNFKIDNNLNIILLDEHFGYEYIILEYVASPQQDGEYYIPIQFKEALIAWLAWKDIQNMSTSSHFNLGDKRDRRHEFYNERRLATARFKPFRLEDGYEANLESQRLTVKV